MADRPLGSPAGVGNLPVVELGPGLTLPILPNNDKLRSALHLAKGTRCLGLGLEGANKAFLRPGQMAKSGILCLARQATPRFYAMAFALKQKAGPGIHWFAVDLSGESLGNMLFVGKEKTLQAVFIDRPSAVDRFLSMVNLT